MFVGDPVLVSRFFYYDTDCIGDCSAWSKWGRWVLLGVIVAICILFILITRTWSKHRVNQGQAPVMGTAWMLPSYQQSQQQYGGAQGPPQPYSGHTAANSGYYNQNGNYVQYHGNTPPEYGPPPGPPPAMSNYGQNNNYEMNNMASGSNGVSEVPVTSNDGQAEAKTSSNGKGSTPAVPPPAYNGS